MWKTARAAALLLLAAGAWAAPEPRVELDPRLEALAAVHLLASGPAPKGFRAPDIEYVRRARKAFSSFKDHRAVKLTAALPAVFDYMQRSDVLVRRGPLPELAASHFTPDFLVVQAGGRERLEEWLSALADFAREADVRAFVRDNAGALDPGLSAFGEDVGRRRYMAKLENFAGIVFEGEYAVAPSVFHLDGSQINSVVRLYQGGYAIVSVVGAEIGPGERVEFSAEDFVATAGHEIAHGLLDAASELSRERIARSSAALGKLPWNCYDDWMQCVKETVVRALMLRLVAAELGDAAARRELESEGREKWPFLKPMVAKLEAYEKDRGRWPDLYAYYPRLLDVLPESSAGDPAGAPVDRPGADWISDETIPFATPGQRAFALRVLGRLLAGAPKDGAWLRRRAALRLTAGDASGAESDARLAVAADPSDPGALLALSLARRALGRGTEAAADMAAAVRACTGARAAGARVACAAAMRAAANDGGAGAGGDPGPDPRVGPGIVSRADAGQAPAARRAQGGEAFEFTVDSRVEFLAEVLASTPSPSRPASVLLFAALKRGLAPIAPIQLLYSYGPAPDFAPGREPSRGAGGALGGDKEVAAFVEALRKQARATGFAARWAASAPAREELISLAREEASRTLSPGAASAWLGQPFPAKVRFVVSEALPSRFATNLTLFEDGRRVEVRMRSVMGRQEKKVYFSFDDFGTSPAHELTHTITDPLVLARADETAASAPLMVANCTADWSECVMEHMVLGVTLRALRAESGEAAYRKTLDVYARRGFPYLPALCETLAEYEKPAARAAGFAAFMPRALKVFGDELKARGGH